MCFTLLAVAARRLAIVIMALLALLLTLVPVLHAQRPVADQDILQYLSQAISWYRNVGSVVQSPEDSRAAMFADGLRQSSSESGLRFRFARCTTRLSKVSRKVNWL